mgnify:CR=1 FL=1
MSKTFVLFDCDGVLVDSEFLASEVMAHMLQSFGFPTTAHDIMTGYVGQKDVQIVASIAQLHGLPLPSDFMAQYSLRLDAELEKSLLPIQGIEEVLKKLKVPRAIVSNSNLARIHISLKSTRLYKYFEAENVFSPDTALFSKPDPRIYLYAITKLGLKKSDVIVVEDSPTGVKASVEAGLDVIGFMGASHATENQEEKLKATGASYIVQNSTELSVLLNKICV